MRLRRLVPLLLLAACTGDPSGAAGVRMEVTPVQAGPLRQWEAIFEVHNTTSHPVYLADLCGYAVRPQLQRFAAGRWVEVPSNEACSLVLVQPVELEPGGLYEGTLRVPEPGRYRLRLHVGPSPTNARTIEASPAFDVPPAD